MTRHPAARRAAPLLMRLAIGLGLALALTLAPALSSGAAADAGAALFSGSTPRTDGTTVIYQVQANPGNWDVDAATVADRTQFPIALGDSQAMYPDIEGDLAVWQETNANGDFDILGRHIDQGLTFTIAGGDRNQVYPALFGDWVVYVSAPHDYSPEGEQFLEVANTTGRSNSRLDSVPVGAGSGGFLRPVISGKRVAWVRMEQTGDHVVHWQLKTQLLGDSSASVVAEEDLDIGGPLGALSTPAYDVNGNLLVYTADLHLTVVDLATGQHTELVNPQAADYQAAQNPTLDGRYIFWQDYRSYGLTTEVISSLQNGTLRSDLMGYDLLSGSEFLVAPHTTYNANPFARGGLLTYEQQAQNGSGAPMVQVMPVSEALPTAPRPNPGDPNVSYYAETGHALAGAFREFWTQSGGLPVFGYPMTEVFTEQGFLVQYLERQRFEAHPEFDGTPYAVELGRLGAEDAAMRGLTATQPFQPLPTGTQSDADCQFFAATGHRLCFGFRAYWQSHGLEFGDPGTSFRESLALFGYPISEEFVDPQTGLVTQYFERARFEYHPDLPEPYRVLLGRLAADVLAQRGW